MSFRSFPLFLCLLASGSLSVLGQGPTQLATAYGANGGNATPIAGAGHDYVHLLSETVDPSSGSVNVRVSLPVPPVRGTFARPYLPIDYSSSNTYQFGADPINGALEFQSHAQLTGPYATWTESTYQVPSSDGVVNTGTHQPSDWVICNVATGFTFIGVDNVVHNLQLSAMVTGPNQRYNGTCGSSTGYGGDEEVSGTFTSTSTTLSDVGQWSYNSSSSFPVNGPVGAFNVTDQNGTTYYFDGNGALDESFPRWSEAPYKIVDRNGNVTTCCVDTLNRSLVTGSGSSFTVDGATYSSSTTGTATVNYTVPGSFSQASANTLSCPSPKTSWSISDTMPGEAILTLPTGQSYKLYYGNYNPTDSSIHNVYGLLNEIIYPDGGWVKYTWPASLSAYTTQANYGGQVLNGNNAGLYQSMAASTITPRPRCRRER